VPGNTVSSIAGLLQLWSTMLCSSSQFVALRKPPGDGVNVAARLEGMNKSFGTSICISDSVFNAVASEIVARPLHHVQVKGRKHDFMIYELVGLANTNMRKSKPVPLVEGYAI
jgi:class 3 adenylate cyclase